STTRRSPRRPRTSPPCWRRAASCSPGPEPRTEIPMAAKKKPDPKKKARKPLTSLDKLTIGEIRKCATSVHGKIDAQGKPELKFPERSLRNARYDKKGGFQMGRA